MSFDLLLCAIFIHLSLDSECVLNRLRSRYSVTDVFILSSSYLFKKKCFFNCFRQSHVVLNKFVVILHLFLFINFSRARSHWTWPSQSRDWTKTCCETILLYNFSLLLYPTMNTFLLHIRSSRVCCSYFSLLIISLKPKLTPRLLHHVVECSCLHKKLCKQFSPSSICLTL